MGFGLEFLLIHITLKYYPFFRYYNLNSPCKVIKQKAKFRASNLTKYLMYRNFGTIFLFVLLGIVLVWVPLLISKLVAPKKTTPDKLSTYECGEESEGSAWIQFNIRFYVIALIFLIFDVEVVFLFPWAVVFKELGLLAFVEMAIFLLILIVGLAYVWKKGDLDWVKYRVKYGRGRYRKIVGKEEGTSIGSA